MPRSWAAAANASLAFPPPDHGFMISTGCCAAPTGVPRDGSSAIVDGSLRSAARASHANATTSTTASTMSPKLWLRSSVAKATTTAATATIVASRRTTPRFVTTYHAAISATSTRTKAPSNGAQLFQSTATITASAPTAQSSAPRAQIRRVVRFTPGSVSPRVGGRGV